MMLMDNLYRRLRLRTSRQRPARGVRVTNYLPLSHGFALVP